ncbi:MAG: hypothetical protein J6T51_06750 [Kiritimatiellae bacterium]|nr:hypothetical protein [Kiritimatiellia bacterium]
MGASSWSARTGATSSRSGAGGTTIRFRGTGNWERGTGGLQPNRLIGDDALLPSGLIGPVVIRFGEIP